MRFKHAIGVAMAIAIGLTAVPAHADYVVRSGDTTPVQLTFKSFIASLIHWPAHVMGGLFSGVPTAVNMTTSGAIDVTPVAIPPGASTATNQAATQANPGADASKAHAIQGVTGGKPVPVSGTFFQGTQPISAASLPLGTGGATATNQTAVQGTFGAQTANKSVLYDASGNPVVWADFTPTGDATLAVTTSSASVALPNTDSTIIIVNNGAADASFKLGTGSPTAATTDHFLGTGRAIAVSIGANTSLAAITASGSTSLKIMQGTGSPFFSGGGGGSGVGGGAATIADGADVMEGAKADSVCGTDTGTCSLSQLIKRLNTKASNTLATQGSITAADAATATTTGQGGSNITTGSPTANSSVTFAIANGAAGGAITISNTFVATSVLEVSYDNAGHYTPAAAELRGSGLTTSSITGGGTFSVDLNGVTHVRVRSTAYTSGTITVDFTYSAAPGLTRVLNTVATTGSQVDVPITQTVTASSAYTTGNALGGLMTIAGAERISTKGSLLQSVTANMKSAQSTIIDVFIFTSNPTASTCTDKTAFVLATADFNKVKVVAHITDWTQGNVASFGQTQNMTAPFNLPSGTTAYACAVVRGTPTYAATSDASFDFNFLRE